MKLSLAVFAFFLLAELPAQSIQKLQWESERPLDWADFKAVPKQNIPYEANTNSGISFSWNYSNESGEPVLEYEVNTNFYPEKSWVKEVEDNHYLLAHEQLHFDISELHARKLRKAIDDYKMGRNIRRELNLLYENIEKQRVQMQNQFDVETNHSQNKYAEAKWQHFITEELKDLEDYLD